MERLDKLLANTGRWSRREARELVRQGRVTVDGAAAAAPEEKYEAGACFAVDGEIISGEKRAYVMLHKPAGLLSATEDPRRPTVMELLPEHLRRMGLFLVGRLDKDTEGFLLITNDGPLNHFLLAPGRHVEKTYYAKAEGTLFPEAEKRFLAGLDIGDDKPTLPAKLEILKQEGNEVELLLTLREGRFHQVKRVVEAAGAEVTYLKRISFGGLPLDGTLEKGGYRPLTEEEVQFLKTQAGMKEG